MIIRQTKNLDVFVFVIKTIKNYLLSRIIDNNYLNECVRFEVMIDDKFAISLCIGPQVNHKTNWNLSKKTQR